jgi:NADH-quinone oxidoreductase subunit A
MSPTVVVAYLALFVTVGFVFLFVSLLLGRLVRPNNPHEEKKEVYECGEPPIGSSFVQFDLRFYVVALLFIIFDVELALFFPWATVFGKATQLSDPNLVVASVGAQDVAAAELTAAAGVIYGQLGVPRPAVPRPDLGPGENTRLIRRSFRTLALSALCDILVFFGVLLVGFAYVWKRGDLDWVRAVGGKRVQQVPSQPTPAGQEAEQALVS